MVRLVFDDFVDLACERLKNFWDADLFEIKTFEDWISSFDECEIGSFKGLVDNFHINGFAEISKAKYKQEEKKGEHYVFANNDSKRYAVVYGF